MSMTRTTTDITPTGDPRCQHCGMPLPPQALFCASCGERVQKKHVAILLQDNRDIATRYRITSLVRRRPYVSLFLATDTEQQRPIALRDIDITSLNEAARLTASTAVQHEYDLLRHQHIPYVIPLIDLRHFQGHLHVVAGWPRDERGKQNPLCTLQDILQSGNGLPDENLALRWIEQLCRALRDLHTSGIIVADLDPQTIILNGDTYEKEMALMVSWLPSAVRNLFPRTSVIANTTNYTAPEVLLGRPEPRSDIYSLGALLYLLLTGTPPEEPTQRSQRRLRLPGEWNARVTAALDDFVMQALAIDAADRFANADAMREALLQLRIGGKRANAPKDLARKQKTGNNGNIGNTDNVSALSTAETIVESVPPAEQGTSEQAAHIQDESNAQRIENIIATDTVAISPLPEKERSVWQGNIANIPEIPDILEIAATPPALVEADISSAETVVVTPIPVVPIEPIKQDDSNNADTAGQNKTIGTPLSTPKAKQVAHDEDTPLSQRFKRRITGILPAMPASLLPKSPSPQAESAEPSQPLGEAVPASNALVPVKPSQPLTTPANAAQTMPVKASAPLQPLTSVPPPEPMTPTTAGNASFFQRLQGLILGEQKQTMTAAAMIEAPMRVQPNQNYSIRIHVTGRNRPTLAPDSKDGAIAGGLSSLIEGDIVSIEVRSALYQNFAYIVQRATVQIPEQDFAAEVTIPMQPLSSGPSGRRDRLHIFFMDEKRRSLYEKPFVIELFISHLVQPGREGHNVLTIPF